VRVVHTPGHSADHVCLFDEYSGDLYGGDMIARGTTVMIPPAPDGSMRDYLASLGRLAALRPGRLLPGHGPIIEDPLTLIGEYIEHRLLREAQILACFTDGVRDVDAIVSRIYPDLPHPVRPAARQTVQSHLEKLREEQRLP
jgi:glyoxylase-like metal-dependent hydrolase (beta-lactamase superfamily II)